MLDQLLTAIEPHLTEILTGIMVWLLSLFVLAVRRVGRALTEAIGEHFGLQAQRIWQDTLHRALRSGVLATDGNVADEEERIDEIIDYAWRSSPEHISALGPTEDVLRALAKAKIREVGAELARAGAGAAR
jgi:hypothetical protein